MSEELPKASGEQGESASKAQLCAICGSDYCWSWTDTHGVAQCFTCGTPYVIYHYEGNKRLNKPPQLMIKPEYVPVLQSYWDETKRRIPSGHSFPGGQELASLADRNAFYDWMMDNAEKHLAHNAGIQPAERSEDRLE